MQTIRSVCQLIVIATFILTVSSFTGAQTRVFISSTGSDLNPCSRTSPCRNYQQAINTVLPGGEVIPLDSAGYGTISITNKSVKIIVPYGIYGGVSVTSGTAVSISLGASDVIHLFGIAINGNGTGTTGVSITGGKVKIEHCSITDFTTGISATNSKVDLIDSDLSGNTTGISSSGSGTEPNGPMTVATALVRIAGGNIINNGTAFFMTNPGTNLVNITMSLMMGSSTFFGWSANVAGNTTLVSGAGTGCPCSSIGAYGGGSNPK